jgi:hypothetical protein
LSQDEVCLARERDLLRILGKKDPIARLEFERDPLAIIVHSALANRDHLTLLRFLFRGVRNNEPADCLIAFFKAPNEHPIMQRCDTVFVPKLSRHSGGP